MKLHRHLGQAITQILHDIFVDRYYADKVLERHFKQNKKWGARDRRFVAEAVYDIVRWWRRLWFSVGAEPTTDINKLWKLLGAWLLIKGEELPSWEEFKFISGNELQSIKTRFEDKSMPLAIYHSLPDWLFELGSEQMGEQWEATIAALNRPAEVVLRANRLKTTPQNLVSILAAEDVAGRTLKDFPDALVLEKRSNVFRTKAFQDGMFEVQDAVSQKVAELLDPKPGERIIDACAGAGGKSLHIAALMNNKGRLLAMDIEGNKLSELRRRATRAGADVIEVRVIENSKSIKRLNASADRLLLDVPCSGSGIWRRNPDSRWKLQPEYLENLGVTQWEILSHYPNMLKPGGILVYSTCSVLPSENQNQVLRFLSVNPKWKLVYEKTFLPQDEGFDGFYLAKLQAP